MKQYKRKAHIGAEKETVSFKGPIKSAGSLELYFQMPFEKLDDIQVTQDRLEMVCDRIKSCLDSKKASDLTIGQTLYEYWGMIEAANCCMSSECMREACKVYIEAIKKLGLDEKLEQPVKCYRL